MLSVTESEMRAIRVTVAAKIGRRGRDRAELRLRQTRDGGLSRFLALY